MWHFVRDLRFRWIKCVFIKCTNHQHHVCTNMNNMNNPCNHSHFVSHTFPFRVHCRWTSSARLLLPSLIVDSSSSTYSTDWIILFGCITFSCRLKKPDPVKYLVEANARICVRHRRTTIRKREKKMRNCDSICWK